LKIFGGLQRRDAANLHPSISPGRADFDFESVGPSSHIHRGSDNHSPARRRRQPRFELLEDRAVPALGFASAFGLAATFPSAPHVAIDAAGDTFVTGSFVGTANFDPAMSSAAAVSSPAGVPDAFVAKYSAAGTLVWAAYFASLSSGTVGDGCLGTAIAVDPATGSVYVVGQFQGMVNFDPGGAPIVLTSSSTTASDAFIAALTPSGTIAAGMVKAFGNGVGGPAFNGLAASASGQNVYVAGGFKGAVNFDPGGTNTTLTSPADGDAFVLGLTSTLGFVFVKEANVDSSEGGAIAVDARGFIAIAGTVDSTQDSFLARFDSGGNPAGARTFLGAHIPGSSVFAAALVTDGTNLYLAGTFTGIGVNFNATTGTAPVTLDSRGSSDAFLIKLDSSLDIEWAYRFGSAGTDVGSALAIDPGGNLYLTGWVSGLATYGTTGLGTAIFYPGNGLSATPNAYVLEVDPNGNPTISPNGPTGSGSSRATGIAVNRAGEVVIVGTSTPPIIFGTTLLQAPGTAVPFVATLTPNSGASSGDSGTTSGGGGTSGEGGGGGVVTPAPALVFTGARPLTTGKGRRKTIIGFALDFSAPLDPAVAGSPGTYQVTQPGRTRRSARKVIPVLAASLGPGGTSVVLVLGKYVKTKPLVLTAAGLRGADGTPLATTIVRL
jgi:hypothetical protein